MNPLPSESIRTAGRAALAEALQASRARTLALLDAYVAALGEALVVPRAAELNPPRWEAGHVAWFQDYWLARNRQRDRGLAADPEHLRPPGRLACADALYNSSKVPHDTRWELPLPDLAATRTYLAESLAESLELLAAAPETPAGLYFYRLALLHEDMHGEAFCYMAQRLDIPLPAGLLAPEAGLAGRPALSLPAQRWRLGYAGPGFAFDNELPVQQVELAPFEIDAEVVSWERYLPFLDATGTPPPRYLRRRGAAWERRDHGSWQPLRLDAPACHLSWFEADAWCRWAGRRLPSEAEWEAAAALHENFCWGQVWEWTASRFEPFPGFAAHPYRDYSQPWFGQRYVLRGGSRATSPRLAHPSYRNFFPPERNDIPAGFRCCRC